MCELCKYGGEYIDHEHGREARQERAEEREDKDKNTGILGAAMRWSNLGNDLDERERG
jgi:hypothetical protein